MDELTLHRKRRLRALIDAAPYGGSQLAFAKATGLSEGRISQLVDPDKHSFGERSARNIANELRLNERYFEMGFDNVESSGSSSAVESEKLAGSSIYDLITSDVGDPIELKRMRRLPVVGEVKGGDDGYLDEFQYPVGHGEGYIEYPTTDPNAYSLRVRGDSMHPRYRAGEFVVVEPGIEPQEGDDVIVICHSGKKMLKQLNWRRDGEVQLLSVNNGYGPLTIPASDIQSMQLVAGRARRNALKY